MLRDTELVVCVHATGLQNIVVQLRLNGHLYALETEQSQNNYLAEIYIEMRTNAFYYDGLVF